MAEELDANTGAESAPESTAPSADVDFETPESSDDGLFSTGFDDVETPVEEPAEPAEEPSTPAEPKQEATPTNDFHKHPRFQQLVADKQRLAEEAKQLRNKSEESERRLAELERKFTERPAEPEPEPEDMMEQMTENPREFFKNLEEKIGRVAMEKFQAQAKEQAAQAAQRQREEKSVSIYKDYFTKNEDALDAWRNGDIQRFQQDNPWADPIAAHKALTETTRIEKARKEALAEAEKNYQAKLKALGRAPANSKPGATPPPRQEVAPKNLITLADTKNYLLSEYLKDLGKG